MGVPLVIHQSDLAAYNRCPEQVHQRRLGATPKQSSRAAYGSVYHHASAVQIRHHSLEKSLATFDHYWHPQNISAVCPPVPEDGWMGRDSYGSLRAKGLESLTRQWEQVRTDEAERLALEYDFVVPLVGTPHYVAGTMDALLVRYRKRKRELHIDDWKTGAQKWGLRWNVQGTVYAYATTQPTFWTGLSEPLTLRRFGTDTVHTYTAEGFGPQRGPDLMNRLENAPRRFMWVNVTDGRWVDGGYRADQDFDRLRLAVNQLAALEQADVWPLRLDGETCQWCEHRLACAGSPLPAESHGGPPSEHR